MITVLPPELKGLPALKGTVGRGHYLESLSGVILSAGVQCCDRRLNVCQGGRRWRVNQGLRRGVGEGVGFWSGGEEGR